jgi:hypothetical protein
MSGNATFDLRELPSGAGFRSTLSGMGRGLGGVYIRGVRATATRPNGSLSIKTPEGRVRVLPMPHPGMAADVRGPVDAISYLRQFWQGANAYR